MGYPDDIVLLLSFMSIASLAAEYKKADDAYRSGNPTMPNWQFDEIEERLRQAAPHHPVLNRDGVVMLSLENNRRQSFDEWYENLADRPTLVVQPKIDGISIGLRYLDGKLVEAQTRKGRCAFDLVKGVHSIPKELKRKSKGVIEIHGELWGLPRDSQDSRTPQSIAAVSARYSRVSGSGLQFDAYRIIGSLGDESRSMEDLRRFGFDVPDTIVCTKAAEVRRIYAEWLSGHEGEKQPFNTQKFRSWPTDGIVVKVFDQRLQRKLGASSKAPRWAIALKKNGRA
jgi:DNA ligase (NAD+)